MTPRIDVDWIDAEDDRDDDTEDIRECRHEQLLVGRGGIDAPLGMILKKDLLDQVLDGKPIDPMAALREPLVVHEATPIFNVLEQFKKAPVRLAMSSTNMARSKASSPRPTCSKPSPATFRAWKARSRTSSSARTARS